MYVVRVVLASVLLIPAALVASGTPASATPGTFTVFTASAGPVDSDGTGGFVVDGSSSALVVSAATPTASVSFQLNPGKVDSSNVDLEISPAAGESLAVGDYTTNTTATTPGSVGLNITQGSEGCGDAPGTVDILQLDTDSSTDAILDFAADYSFDCDGQGLVTGVLRWNSTVPYSAISHTPDSWNFGSQLIKTNGTPRTFTFVNRGTGAETFGAASFSGTAGTYTASANTCSGMTVEPAASCAVTVVPHPVALGGGMFSNTVDHLNLKVSGEPTIAVVLQAQGVATAPLTAEPGAAKITLSWEYVGVPISASVTGYDILRGPSPSDLSYYKAVAYGPGSYTDTAISTGKAYYYAIRPELSDGTSTPPSPVVAAEAWPKYSAGMYHRISTPQRLVSGHVVEAGHPYTLRVFGLHGIATSDVSAVALDLEVSDPSATTSVWVYPAGSARPAAANLYVGAKSTRTNFVLANLGKGGAITIFVSHGSAPVYLDASGYFSAAGLSSAYGEGGSLQEYLYPGTILDTKAYKIGALKHDYEVDAPVNFDPVDASHVTSLLVEVTAYGSSGSGTLTGYATNDENNAPIPNTTVLAYSPGVTTSNLAIISAGSFYSSTRTYPSVSFLNRGKDSVQLVVTILGFFDDNSYFLYGARYVPTAPVHLFDKSMGSDSNDTFAAGTHGDTWTAAFNLDMAAYTPTATTELGLRAIGYGSVPQDGELHAYAHVTSIGSVLNPVGNDNEMSIHNSSGRVNVSLWSFGRFEGYPQPSAYEYSNGDGADIPTAGIAQDTSPARLAS